MVTGTRWKNEAEISRIFDEKGLRKRSDRSSLSYLFKEFTLVPESLFSLPTFLSPKLLGIKENAYTDVNTTDLTTLLFGPPLVFQTHKNSRFRCKNIRGLAAPERFFSFSLYSRPSYRILPDDTRG